MADHHEEDYAWDHAGETLQEDSPLLGEQSTDDTNLLASYNRLDHIRISRRQAEYLLHTLQDNTTLVQTLLIANDDHPDPFNGATSCRGCRSVLKLVQDSVLLVTVVLQVLTLILLSILESTDTNGKGKEAVVAIIMTSQSLNFVVFAVSLPRLIWMIWRRTYSRIYLLEMYVTSTLVFAGMYLMTYALDSDSWLTAGCAANTHSATKTPTHNNNTLLSDKQLESGTLLETVANELMIVTYVKMAHTSLCTASMFGNPAFIAVRWYNFLLQIAQLVVSLTLVLCLVSQAITYTATHRHRLMRTRSRRARRNSATSRDSGNSYGALDSYVSPSQA